MGLQQILINWHWLMPELFLLTASVLLIGFGAISSTRGRFAELKNFTFLTILTLFFTFFILLYQSFYIDNESIGISGGLYVVDSWSIFIKNIVILSGISILFLSLDSWTQEKIVDFELCALILLSILGMMILISSQDMVLLYLGIELTSLSLYAMASIKRGKELSTEAGLKYFIMGALSSGILLMGCTSIYLETGETNWSAISSFGLYSDTDLVIGSILVVIALLFKLAAAPFHMWVPDVYEGSPTIVTGYFATVPKIALITTLWNLIKGPFIGVWSYHLQYLILGSAILSIIIAGIGGINQAIIKRLIGYSAIGHMGFMLLGIGVSTLGSLQATFIYAIIYIIMSLNSFGCLVSIFKGSNSHISNLWTISRTSPILSLTFIITLFSIAGIPPLAGFLSKYMILLTAVEGNFTILAIIAVIFTCVSCFYYLRIINVMYFKDKTEWLVRGLYTNVAGMNRSIKEMSIERAIIISGTFYLILTLLLYPKPIMMLTFDSIMKVIY